MMSRSCPSGAGQHEVRARHDELGGLRHLRHLRHLGERKVARP